MFTDHHASSVLSGTLANGDQAASGAPVLLATAESMRKHETIDPFSAFTIMRHGVSTTDRCLGWDATERMLRQGHEAGA